MTPFGSRTRALLCTLGGASIAVVAACSSSSDNGTIEAEDRDAAATSPDASSGGSDPSDASTCSSPPVATDTVSLQQYYDRLETVRNAISALPALGDGGTAPAMFDPNAKGKQFFDGELKETVAAYAVVSPLVPPTAIATEHFELLGIMDGRRQVDLWLESQVPDGASSQQAEVTQYRTAIVGQLRRRLEDLDCRLDAIARDNGLQVPTYGPNCGVAMEAPEPKILGSASEPVSEVDLKSKDLMVGAEGQAIPAPDLDFGYTTVYARAGALTLVYDNENPAPFKHNAVIYRNATGTNLRASEIVDGTPGGSGPSVNRLTVTLAPGNYSIVCNVHLDLQMTKLIVVP